MQRETKLRIGMVVYPHLHRHTRIYKETKAFNKHIQPHVLLCNKLWTLQRSPQYAHISTVSNQTNSKKVECINCKLENEHVRGFTYFFPYVPITTKFKISATHFAVELYSYRNLSAKLWRFCCWYSKSDDLKGKKEIEITREKNYCCKNVSQFVHSSKCDLSRITKRNPFLKNTYSM